MDVLRNPRVLIATSIAMTITLIIIVGVMASRFAKQAGARNWPQVAGTVVRTEIDEELRRNRATFRPRVFYRYEVEGVERMGDRIRLIDPSTSHQGALDRVNKYQAGSNVWVQYDPDDPDTALLETGIGRSEVIGMAALSIGLFAVAANWAVAIRALRRERPKGMAPSS
jgi:hypothetical protein